MGIRFVGARLVVLVALSFTAACGTRPDTEIDAAAAALNDAQRAEAERYAPAALQQAQTARKALDNELVVQEQAWFPAYDNARALATTAKVEADKAASDARAAKLKADNDAEAARKAARRATAVTTVKAMARATEPVKIGDVMPEYPEIARSAGVQGTVTIAATVGADGTVRGAKVIRSVPLLDAAALEAVKQWTYKPSTLNGKAVPADLVVNVQFVR
jgi:TonB family protein